MSINLNITQTGKDPTRNLPAAEAGTKVAAVDVSAAREAASGKELPPAEAQTEQLSPEQLRERVAELNDYIQTIQRSVQFMIDNDSGRTVVKVVDTNTDELIRQIPSEELLNISRTLREHAESYKGIFVKSSI